VCGAKEGDDIPKILFVFVERDVGQLGVGTVIRSDVDGDQSHLTFRYAVVEIISKLLEKLARIASISLAS
jgi:hypothetical protein